MAAQMSGRRHLLFSVSPEKKSGYNKGTSKNFGF
jgi:hypothetical protein